MVQVILPHRWLNSGLSLVLWDRDTGRRQVRAGVVWPLLSCRLLTLHSRMEAVSKRGQACEQRRDHEVTAGDA